MVKNYFLFHLKSSSRSQNFYVDFKVNFKIYDVMVNKQLHYTYFAISREVMATRQ